MRTADNRVRTVIERYGKGLASMYEAGEVKAIVRTVFQDRLGWDASQLEFRKDGALSESELLKVYDPLERLMTGEPVQYTLGSVRFHGLEIGVAPGVLIPRPETEEMVQRIIDEGRAPERIVDVGTGSGCIALALKKAFPEAQVIGIDVSEAALEQARNNGLRNALDVEWIRMDVLDENMDFPDGMDILVSNPPYVPRSESGSLSEQVRGHEPHLALFVEDEDPLCFHRVIAQKAVHVLTADGRLFLEGHHRYTSMVGDLLREMGYRNVKVCKDLSGNERSIEADRP